MVKKVHPDSGHPEASAEKFQEVDESFKFLMEKHAKARRNIELDLDDEVKVFDIKVKDSKNLLKCKIDN